MFVERFRNKDKMLKEFCSCIFKSLIYHSNFQRHIHHVQSIHRHPACAISLLQYLVAGYFNAPVKHTDIIQPKKTALENAVSTGIFPVDPPGKIDDELMKYFL